MARYTKDGHTVETSSPREAAALKARGYIAETAQPAKYAAPRQRTQSPPPSAPSAGDTSSGDEGEK